MASTMLDSEIFRDMFGTEDMRAIFSDANLVRKYLDVEATLARVQGSLGVIPFDAANAIDRAAREIRVDFDRLRQETEVVGYPILPLVRQLAEAAGEAGGVVHWGATTQDIMDTAVVLQVRDALDIVGKELEFLRDSLAGLAERYRDTPMAGRTHLQQALPVTFGYKAAVWLSMILRHIQRLKEVRSRVLVGSFSGAAGTLASLGGRGLEVQEALCRELKLDQPLITWHVARDSIAETVLLLGLLTGSLAKIATDVSLMMSTEFGEVAEPFVKYRGASSTMPQKRNPISCELILACAKAVRHQAAMMLDAMVQDFERATGPWHLEWLAVPESFVMTAGALSHARFLLDGLVVDAERMLANLQATDGLIVAEAVMMAAAPALGRQAAHDRVYEACRRAIEARRPLADELEQVPDIVLALGKDGIRFHCNPVNYLGQSAEMVDRLLFHARESARSRSVPVK